MPDTNPISDTPPSNATPNLKNATPSLGTPNPNTVPKRYEPGATIGRYIIDQQVGRGGMATIYLATDPTTERQVAIKLMPYQFNLDPEMRARFQREARVIALLDHPNVVPVYDVGEDNDQLYIVMRYMAGGSLAQRMMNRFSPEDTLRIARQIAGALDAIHAQHIVHRDLKPDNILFDADGNAYLSDFGIVKLVESSTLQTPTGTSAGTPAYMSPEQIESKVELDGRSDVYALAIILFEMLSGRAPYVADTPIGLVAQHLFDPVPQIRTLRPDLPLVMQSVIERGLAKDREERYPTAGELVDDLQAAFEGRQFETRKVRSAAGRVTVYPDEVERRRPIAGWVFGFLSVGGAVMLALMLVNGVLDFRGEATPGATIVITVINTQGTPEVLIVTATPDEAANEATDEADQPTPTATPTRGTGTRPSATVASTTRPTDPPSGDSSTGGSNDSGGSSTTGGGGPTNTPMPPATNTPRPTSTNTPKPPPTASPTPEPPTATPTDDDGGLLGGIVGGLLGGDGD